MVDSLLVNNKDHEKFNASISNLQNNQAPTLRMIFSPTSLLIYYKPALKEKKTTRVYFISTYKMATNLSFWLLNYHGALTANSAQTDPPPYPWQSSPLSMSGPYPSRSCSRSYHKPMSFGRGNKTCVNHFNC